MKKHTPIHIYDEVFKQNYYISYGTNRQEFVKSVKRILGFELEDEKPVDGKTYEFDNEGVSIIWVWTREKDISLLAHELAHAVFMCLSIRRINPIDSVGEVFAYILQMLMRKVLK